MSFETIVSEKCMRYMAGLFRNPAPTLQTMEQYAQEKVFPIVGPVVGQTLTTLALGIGAEKIFEFGSGFGYSAYWFAKAVEKKPGGKVYCTEMNADNVARAKRNLTELGVIKNVEYFQEMGQVAFQKVNQTNKTWDILYNDAEKYMYPEIWKLCRDSLRVGGYYIADNVLWGGMACNEPAKSDEKYESTHAIREHNALVAADSRFQTFINPVRDGLMVALKIKT